MAGARASESIGSHGPHGTRDNGGSHSYHHGQNGESHSPMWRRSTCMLGKPMLGGVKHGQRLFMPVSSLRKKNLDAPTKQFVQKCSRPKMAATKNLKTKVLAPGGDNVAEGLVSHIKGTARRLGSLRGGRATSSRSTCVRAQSSAALLREPGLFRVLEACKNFREACMAGKLRACVRRNAFDTEQHAWLTDAGVMEDDL